MEIYKINPVFKNALWASTTLKDQYYPKCTLDRISESWILTWHKDGTNTLEDGRLLSDVLADKKSWGNKAQDFEFFPTMVKLIGAETPLSIQVHPSDELALKTEGQYGKTECWYILDCDENSYIYYGFNQDMTLEKYKESLESGTLINYLNKVMVKKGDCFMVNSGTIHAIGTNILLAEVQQNSNITYRLYDYNRKDANGNPRQLHIPQALGCTNLKKTVVNCLPLAQKRINDAQETLIAQCPYFKAYSYDIESTLTLDCNRDSFVFIGCTFGQLNVSGITITKGESVFVPAQKAEIKISGKGSVIVTRL